MEDVTTYTAGFVVKKNQKVISCLECLDMLEIKQTLSKLQDRKTYGKLSNASKLLLAYVGVQKNLKNL